VQQGVEPTKPHVCLPPQILIRLHDDNSLMIVAIASDAGIRMAQRVGSSLAILAVG
jgi:hypothetical protein